MNFELFPSELHARDRLFAVVDTETTGLYPERGDRLIEVAAIRLRGPTVTAMFSTLIHPGRAIPAEVTRINGITDDMVEGLPGAAEAMRMFTRFVEDVPLVMQNAPFDLGFLNAELVSAGMQPLANPVLDTRLLARLFWPDLAGYGLDRLAARAGVAPSTGRHRALADTELTLGVFRALLDEAKRASITSFEELRARSEALRGESASRKPNSATPF